MNFLSISFLYITKYQALDKTNIKTHLFRHPRKPLFYQGFDFVNPENNKFEKNAYLD